MRTCRALYPSAALLLLYSCACADQSYLVTVETASQATADTTSTLVDASAQHLIGVIEGTQSRVQTLGADYHPASIERAPMLVAMQDVSFDTTSAMWTFVYDSIPADASINPGNDYKRVLYFSSTSGAPPVRGDTSNVCLSSSTPSACTDHLRAQYVVPNTLASDATLSTDHIATATTCDSETCTAGADCCLTVSSTLLPDSEIERITISLHQTAVSTLVGQTLYAEDGATAIGWQFNIGMMFVYDSGSNMNIVEHFHVLEQAYQQTAISKVNQYTIARHVQFYLADGSDAVADLRMLKLEFLLDTGHVPYSGNAGGSFVRLSMDNVPFVLSSSNDACRTLQSAISLAEDTCLNPVVTPGTEACTPLFDAATGVLRIVVPITIDQSMLTNIGIEIAIETETDTAAVSDPPLLSMLQMTAPARDAFVKVCQTPQTQSFDAISHVQLDVYNKDAADDSLQLLDTTTDTATMTFSSIQSLLTFVLRPTSSDASADYFTANPDKRMHIDDLYIAHSLSADMFTNYAVNTPTAARLVSQRSQLQFMYQGYTEFCPELTEDTELLSDPQCVLTHDYGLDSGQHQALERSITGGYYVHELVYIGVFDLTDDAALSDEASIPVEAQLQFALLHLPTQNVIVTCSGTAQAAVTTSVVLESSKHATYYLLEGVSDTCTAQLLDEQDTVIKTVYIDTTTNPAAADMQWLDVVYGTNAVSDRNLFHQRAFRTVRESTLSKIYWVWPIYDWPQSPLGLVDTSQVHVAWSVTEEIPAPPPSAAARRLLTVPSSSLSHIQRLYDTATLKSQAVKARSAHRMRTRLQRKQSRLKQGFHVLNRRKMPPNV